MSELQLTDSRLSELEHRFTDKLMTAEIFDVKAFEEFLAHLRQRAEDLKNHPSVPKQYLQALLRAASAIRSRAEYLSEVRLHLRKAAELEVLLGLVASGESPSARQPGVPRII